MKLNLSILIILTLYLSSLQAQEVTSTQVSSSHSNSGHFGLILTQANQNWSEPPLGFEEKEIAPPLITLNLGGEFSRPDGLLVVDASLARTNDNFMYFHNNMYVEKRFSKPGLSGLFGVEYMFSNMAENKRYEDTMFDYLMYGLDFGLKYQYKRYQFYFKYDLRTATDAIISKNESITTKIRHEWDNFIKFGVNTHYKKFLFFAEFAHFRYAKTKILSKEFAFIIDDSSVYRTGLGLGYNFSKYDIWFKSFTISSPEDEVSYFFQAPHFGPDYSMAKQTIQMEFIWKL